MPDPWVYLNTHHPDVGVRVRADLGTSWGQTVWQDDGPPVIYLAHDLGRIQRRCTLAHELMHVEQGPPEHPLCRNDEAAVRALTARWLLPDLGLVGRLLQDYRLRDAAQQLCVTRGVLVDRLDYMTDAEVGKLSDAIGGAARVATPLAAYTPTCPETAFGQDNRRDLGLDNGVPDRTCRCPGRILG